MAHSTHGEQELVEALVALASATTPDDVEARRSEVGALLGERGPWTTLLDTLADRSLQVHRLERLATQDPLTGLANRRSFAQALKRELQRRRRVRGPAVVLLDLDGLKDLNDRFGHGAGDDAIRATAGRCLACVRAEDLAARLGGDEFAVLLPDTDLEGARIVAHRLRDAIEGTRVCGEPLRVSVGIAVTGPDGDNEGSLLAVADERLYRDKRQRKGQGLALVA